LPVGIPNSLEPLPNPLTTMPLAKNGKQPSVLVVGISNFGGNVYDVQEIQFYEEKCLNEL
jgi:hypothetical protein